MATCKLWQPAVSTSFTLQGKAAVCIARQNEEEKGSAPEGKVIEKAWQQETIYSHVLNARWKQISGGVLTKPHNWLVWEKMGVKLEYEAETMWTSKIPSHPQLPSQLLWRCCARRESLCVTEEEWETDTMKPSTDYSG